MLLQPDIVAVTLKERVRSDENSHLEVALGAAVDARIARAADVEYLPVVDTGGDIHLNARALGYSA